MLTLAWGLFLLVLLAGAGAVLAALLDCDAALLPLPLLSAAALVLYPFGMLGNLRIGAAAAVLLLGVAVVVGVVRLRPAGVGTAVKTALTRPGFALFLGGAAFIWCLFALHRPMFTQWDEFTAWGLAPKMVVERAAFYVADPVNLKASFTYPATSLVTFLFQPFGSWAEWACLAALDTLALACVAAASALPRPQWAGGILVFGTGFVLPFFFSNNPAGSYAPQYANAMADLPLAMLFGGALCLYYSVGHRRRAFWLTGLPLMLLTLTKDICFAYGLIAAFLIGLDQLVTADKPIKQSFPRAFLRAGGLAVCVVAAFVSWSRYTAAVTPTVDTGASVGSAGLSYGAVLTGGVKQLLGIGRDDKFAQIMAAMAMPSSPGASACWAAASWQWRLLTMVAAAAFLPPKRPGPPPCTDGASGVRVLLRRVVCVPPHFVLLQFLGRGGPGPQGLRPLFKPLLPGVDAGYALSAGPQCRRPVELLCAGLCGRRCGGYLLLAGHPGGRLLVGC